MATETFYATALVSGAVGSSANALGAPDGVFTTDADSVSWTARFAMGDPVGNKATGTHFITLRVRKETGTGTPTITNIRVYSAAGLVRDDTTVRSVTSTTGMDIQTNIDSASLAGVALSTLEVEIVAVSSGGSPSARSTVQLDGITWSGNFIFAGSVAPSGSGTLAASGRVLSGFPVVSSSISGRNDRYVVSAANDWATARTNGSAFYISSTGIHISRVIGCGYSASGMHGSWPYSVGQELLEFPISIPPGAAVESATLSFYSNVDASNATGVDISVYPIAGQWDGQTSPFFAPTALSQAPRKVNYSYTASGTQSIPLTPEVVRDAEVNGALRFLIAPQKQLSPTAPTTNESGSFLFADANDGFEPKLQVTFVEQPTGAAAFSGSGDLSALEWPGKPTITRAEEYAPDQLVVEWDAPADGGEVLDYLVTLSSTPSAVGEVTSATYPPEARSTAPGDFWTEGPEAVWFSVMARNSVGQTLSEWVQWTPLAGEDYVGFAGADGGGALSAEGVAGSDWSNPSVSLGAEGSLVAIGEVGGLEEHSGATDLSGGGTLTAEGVAGSDWSNPSISLGAEGSLTASGMVLAQAQVNLSGQGATTAVAAVFLSGAAAYSATGTLSAAGSATGATGVANFSGLGSLVATGSLTVAAASASLAGAGALSAVGEITGSSVELSGFGKLHAAAKLDQFQWDCEAMHPDLTVWGDYSIVNGRFRTGDLTAGDVDLYSNDAIKDEQVYFDATDSAFFFELASTPGPDSGGQFDLNIFGVLENFSLVVNQDQGINELSFWRQLEGFGWSTIGPIVAYDPDAHRWLRVRFEGSTIHFDAGSATGIWTTLFSTSTVDPLTAVWIDLYAYTVGTTPAYYEYDNFNINAPTTSESHAGATDFSGSGTLTAEGVAGSDWSNPSISLGAEGALTASGAAGVEHEGAADLSAGGALVAAGSPILSGTAAYSATGTLSASGSPTGLTDVANLSGLGELVAVGIASPAAQMELTGSGALNAEAGAAFASNLDLTGSGQLEATSLVSFSGTAATSALGTLSAAGSPTGLTGVGNLSGSGELTAAGIVNAVGAAQLASDGTASAQAQVGLASDVALAGAGDLATTGDFALTQSVNLTGSGSASAVGAPSPATQAGPTGSGELLAESLVAFSGEAAYSALGALSAVGSQTGYSDVANLSGAGELTVVGTLAAATEVDLSGSGSSESAGTPAQAAVVELSGQGALNALTGAIVVDSAGLSGSGSLDAIGTVAIAATAAPSGAGALDAESLVHQGGEASFSSLGTLSVAGSSTGLTVVGNPSGTGDLTAVGGVASATSTALSGQGTLAAEGIAFRSTQAALGGTGALDVEVETSVAISAGASGAGTLVAQAQAVTASGATSLSGSGSVAAAGSGAGFGHASLAGSGSLEATGKVLAADEASITGSGELTVTSVRVGQGQPVGLTGLGSLVAVGVAELQAQATFEAMGSLVALGTAESTGITELVGDGTLVVVGARHTATIMDPDGIRRVLFLRGEWDGVRMRPLTLRGAWNGSGYDPVPVDQRPLIGSS